MAHASAAKGPVARSTAGSEAKKSLFDKRKPDTVVKVKTYKKEEVRTRKRAELLELAKVVGVITAGTDTDVADRPIVKFETMRNNDPDAMIVENFFYFAFKGFP